ncbi:MAG: hypothetical protein ACFBSD_11560 [Paracoccaceae bacterium]
MTATTTPQTPLQKVCEIVEREARAWFGDVQIAKVDVGEEEDSEGWSFLAITLFVTEPDLLDPKRLVGLIGKLRDALSSEIGEERFPLVMYDEETTLRERNAEV